MNGLYYIISDNNDLIELKIKEIIKNDSNLIKYNMQEDSIVQLLIELDSYNLLSNSKNIIIYNCNLIDSENIIKYLEHPNLDNNVFFVAPKLDERKKFTKVLRKTAKEINSNISLNEYVKNKLNDFDISFKTINFFIDYCNNNILKLNNEIDKLKSYKLDNRVITEDDIKNIVKKEIDDSDNYIYSFVNAIINKNRKKSLAIYQELLSLNKDSMQLLSLLANQFRLIYQVKVLISEGMKQEDIVKKLVCHPYAVTKALENGYNYQEKDLIKYLSILEKMDYQIKTGITDSDKALSLFLIEV